MKKPNILLVVLDATRADYCSCYNRSRSITPALDELAAEGVIFQRAFASAPWTLPAMASILTGHSPAETNIEATRVLASGSRTLAARLREQEYASFVISKNSWFGSGFGLTQDFDVFHKLWQLLQTETDLNEVSLTQAYPDQNLLVGAVKGAMRGNWLKNAANLASRRIKVLNDRDYGARRTLRPVQQWISGQTGPWFAMVHYLEAHLEYKPPLEWARRFVDDPPLAQRLLTAQQWRLCYRHMTGVEPLTANELQVWRQLYAAEVAYQDHALGQLLQWLRQTGRYEDTFVIVVADHGESLGEHGLLNHGYGLYEPLIHVPLVMRGPGVRCGDQVSGLVQTSDIFGTVLAVAGAPLPAQGRNLLDAGAVRRYVVAEYGPPRVPHPDLLARYALQASDFARFRRSLVSVRTEAHKLITGSDGTLELYDLAADPGENDNRVADAPVVLAEMQRLLAEWRLSTGLDMGQQPVAPAAPVVAPEVAARLKALGYLD
ncbi:MAG: sulfatase [Nitrososphaerales archaeon]